MSSQRLSPAVKRLMREAEEFSLCGEQDYHATPMDSNVFEWHFTIRGPRDSEFEHGVYHGRITLPVTYPMEPPSIIFLTPNGRFEINKKICLSISGHHPESWQPSWSIRTVLVALIAFMPTPGLGTIGSLDYGPIERVKLARESKYFFCKECGMANNLLGVPEREWKRVAKKEPSDLMEGNEHLLSFEKEEWFRSQGRARLYMINQEPGNITFEPDVLEPNEGVEDTVEAQETDAQTRPKLKRSVHTDDNLQVYTDESDSLLLLLRESRLQALKRLDRLLCSKCARIINEKLALTLPDAFQALEHIRAIQAMVPLDGSEDTLTPQQLARIRTLSMSRDLLCSHCLMVVETKFTLPTRETIITMANVRGKTAMVPPYESEYVVALRQEEARNQTKQESEKQEHNEVTEKQTDQQYSEIQLDQECLEIQPDKIIAEKQPVKQDLTYQPEQTYFEYQPDQKDVGCQAEQEDIAQQEPIPKSEKLLCQRCVMIIENKWKSPNDGSTQAVHIVKAIQTMLLSDGSVQTFSMVGQSKLNAVSRSRPLLCERCIAIIDSEHKKYPSPLPSTSKIIEDANCSEEKANQDDDARVTSISPTWLQTPPLLFDILMYSLGILIAILITRVLYRTSS